MRAILRENYRWILLKIISEAKYDKRQIESAIKSGLLQAVGELGFAQILPKLFYFDGEFGIVRVLRDGVDVARRAFPLITSVDGKEVRFQTLFTSGTLRKCKEIYYAKRQQEGEKRKNINSS